MAADELSLHLTAKDDLTGKVKDTRTALQQLKKDVAAANREFMSSGTREAKANYDRLVRQLGETESSYRQLREEVRRTDKAIDAASRGVTTSAGRMHGGMSRFIGYMKANPLASVLSVAAVVAFGKASLEAFAEAEQGQIRLQEAFRKFPKIADTNIDRLSALNAEMEKKKAVDADSLSAADSVLARFDLTGKQIEQLTPLLADYAIATGKDVTEAAGLLGKALLGNARALKDIGIDFKVTGNRAADAEKIMGLLAQKVGGAGEAFRATAAGGMKAAELSFGNMQESIGQALAPSMQVLADTMADLEPTVAKLAETFGRELVGGLKESKSALDGFTKAAGGAADLFDKFTATDLGHAFVFDIAPFAALDRMVKGWEQDGVIGALLGFGGRTRIGLGNVTAAADALDALPPSFGNVKSAAAAATQTVSNFGSTLKTTAWAADRLSGSLSGIDKLMAQREAVRAYEKALADYVKKPSAETGDAVVSAMSKAAQAIEKPADRAKFVTRSVKEIETTVAKSNVKQAVKDRITDPLQGAEAKARGVLAALAPLKAFVPSPINFTITVNGKPVTTNSMSDLRASFLNSRAAGGPVDTMSPYLVGEVGPELYVPRIGPAQIIGADGPELRRFTQAGTVVPNHALVPPPPVAVAGSTTVAAGGSATVNIGTINAERGVDVQSEVLHAMMRADRIARERR